MPNKVSGRASIVKRSRERGPIARRVQRPPVAFSLPIVSSTRIPGIATAPGYIGLDPEAVPVQDVERFARVPAALSLCGTPKAAKRFPGSLGTGGYAYLLQRLSDYAYTVSAYCASPSRGARCCQVDIPVSGKARGTKQSTVWVPPAGCCPGGPSAPAAECVCDTVHLDLVNPANGKSRLTKGSLLASVSAVTTHLFLNSFRDAAVTCEAIGTLACSEFACRACIHLALCTAGGQHMPPELGVPARPELPATL